MKVTTFVIQVHYMLRFRVYKSWIQSIPEYILKQIMAGTKMT